MSELFKNLVEIEVARQFPQNLCGRPRKRCDSEVIDDIFHVVRTGIQWRELRPKRVSYITVFKTMHLWMSASVFRKAYVRLLRLYSRKRRPRYLCLDSSYVKNIYGRDVVGRNPTDRGRRATKLSAVVDDLGVPYSLRCDPGNMSDMKLFGPALSSIMKGVDNVELFADKGYDSKTNRAFCTTHNMADRIFKRKATCSRRTHAKRNVVERFFSWLDKHRRLILRYEQRASVYLEMTFVACGRVLGKRLGGTLCQNGTLHTLNSTQYSTDDMSHD